MLPYWVGKLIATRMQLMIEKYDEFLMDLTLSQTSPGFYVSARQVF